MKSWWCRAECSCGYRCWLVRGQIILMQTALDIVHSGLAGRKTRAMLIGAYALQTYGVVRQTSGVRDRLEGYL